MIPGTIEDWITPDSAAVSGSVQRLVLPGCVLYRADCREVLGEVKADAIITDPPYGISFAAQPTKWQRRAGKLPESWDDSTIPDVVLSLPGMADVCVVWGGNYYGLPCTRGWLMWRKPDAPPSMAHGELAWTSRDQNLKVIDWSISATNAERVGHPTQKPVRVMSWSMEQAGVPDGATVFDPFMGSGSTAIACIRTGRPFIGVERDPEHFKTAVERIRRELAQGDLFLGQNMELAEVRGGGMSATKTAAMNMVEVGNGFERALGLAMIAGSDEQRGMIESAFPEILERYAPAAFPDDLAPPFGPDHPFVISPDQVGL